VTVVHGLTFRRGVPARRNDGSSTPFGDGIVALSGAIGPVGGDAGDLVIRRDLVEQLQQHRGIAHIAACERGGPDFQRLLVGPDVDLAPDAMSGAAMLAPSSGNQSTGLFADPSQSTRLRRRP
jgi:hypothetical protein